MKKAYFKKFRHPKAHLSSFTLNFIQQRNPLAILWWSAAFPGIGHLMLGKYLTGALLTIWEFFVNAQAHINEGIFYSLIGNFEMAKATIDTHWFLLYIFVYIFTMWDSYRLTIDLNKYSQLADRIDPPFNPSNMGGWELNFLAPRSPWSSAFWGFFYPGLETIYNNKLIMGFFGLGAFIVSIFNSNALPAVHLTFEGKTELARSIINPQWFLNLPSLMLAAAYDGYHDIQGTNKLFEREQSRYLITNYQPKNYIMPNRRRKKSMYLISTFQHSAYVELALIELEQKSIPKENIFVAPLEETTHKENMNKYDLAFILGAIFMLLGSIYGFVLVWGPIIWAFMGLIFGATLGMFISFIMNRSSWFKEKSKTKIIIIIECEKHQTELVERLLWQHEALVVTKV